MFKKLFIFLMSSFIFLSFAGAEEILSRTESDNISDYSKLIRVPGTRGRFKKSQPSIEVQCEIGSHIVKSFKYKKGGERQIEKIFYICVLDDSGSNDSGNP